MQFAYKMGCIGYVALLAEPKTCLESSVFMGMSNGIFVHNMKHCYETALSTTQAQALRYTCVYSLPRMCNHEYTEGMWKISLKNG